MTVGEQPSPGQQQPGQQKPPGRRSPVGVGRPQAVDYRYRRRDVDPYPAYAAMQERAPVSPLAGLRTARTTWLVTSHDLARQCLSDLRLSSDRRKAAAEHESGRLQKDDLLGLDPPDHTRLRRLVTPTFSPSAVRGLRPMIRRTCERAIGAFRARGSAELVGEYCLAVPVAVIHEILGVPPARRETAQTCMDLYWRASFLHPYDAAAVASLREYIAAMMAYKRAHPGQDLATALLGGLARGELTEEELHTMLFVVLGDGHATTMPFLGSGIFRLLERPGLAEALAGRPGAWPGFVEEVLRFDSPVQTSQSRYALADLTIGETAVSRGDVVLVSLAAAGRDPGRFTQPDEFVSGRGDRQHLAFGHGVHFCLGAHLARAQGEIAFATLFRRLPDLRLGISPSEVAWTFGPTLRGPRELPATFTSRAPARSAGRSGGL